VTKEFQGCETKTRCPTASTTLGYKNKGFCAGKNVKKNSFRGVVKMTGSRVFDMTRSVFGGSQG
jgi:hypothetical protein